MQSEFEKQVQKKLEELQVHPSAPVWQNIKKEIAPAKDRRRIIFWFFLSALVITGGLYLLPASVAPKLSGDRQNSTQHEKGSGPASRRIPGQQASTPGHRHGGSSGAGSTTTTFNHGIATGRNASTAEPSATAANDITRDPASAGSAKGFSQNARIKTQQPGLRTGNAKRAIPDSIPKAETPVEQAGNNGYAQAQMQPGKTNANDSLSAPVKDSSSASPAIQIIPQPKDSISKPMAPPKTRKLTARVHLSLGRSSRVSGLALFNKSLADYLSSPGSNSGNPPGNGLAPGKETPGISFSAGLSLRKELNHHFSLAAGVEYDFFSTHIKTGQRVRQDTIVNSGYSTIQLRTYFLNSTAPAHDYTNQYHFLGLPLTLQYKTYGNLPLNISLGISLKQLIAGNALIYHYQGQFYYHDMSAFRKTQLFSSAGISYSPGRLDLGPWLQYGLSKTMSNGSGNKHLFAAGLKAEFSLNK